MEKLSMYLQYPFVQYALVVGTLIALCSALLGTILVLKRMSFIGEGLSRVAFCAASIGGLLHMTSTLPLEIIIAVVIAIVIIGYSNKFSGDSTIAMISVSAMGIGYLLINRFSSSANISADVCGALFGSTSILTLSQTDVVICTVTSLVVIVGFVLMYNKIFSITFDETFTKTTGLNTKLYNIIISSMIAIVIVLAMNLVGSLLITALVVFPVMTASQMCKSFKNVVIFSAVIGTLSAFAGLIVAVLLSIPVGSTITIVDLAVFVLFSIISKIKGVG